MEDNYPDAIERMAEAYLGDELGLEKDEKTALKLFKRAAKLGNAAAQYNLGMAYACGYYGVTPDKDKALHWLKRVSRAKIRRRVCKWDFITTTPSKPKWLIKSLLFVYRRI